MSVAGRCIGGGADPAVRVRAAGIDAAIAGAVGAGSPVRAAAGSAAEKVIRFEFEGAGSRSAGHWLPFTAGLGELFFDHSTLVVGLGREAAVTVESVRHAAALAAARMSPGSVAIQLPPGPDWLARAACDGLASTYEHSRPVELIVAPSALEGCLQGLLTADAVRLAKRLVNAPANVLSPSTAAAWATDIAEQAGLDCTVLDAEELRASGFRALAAIGSGSVNGPRLVSLQYRGEPGSPNLSLVGKGITFDSGGLSLKSPAAMQSMRLDVAGAACVLAVMASLRRTECRINVRAVLPFAENLPGPGAVMPGDVVTAWNGTEVQILDTDFEGRVVLADALALAAAESPDLMIDLATLTYQAEIALGAQIGAAIGPDATAMSLLLAAAEEAGEPMWQLPWAERYLEHVRTPFGVRNHPLNDTGRALTAALFLGEFVPRDVPWVHCDITGPSFHGDASQDGATGFGVRTLLRLISRLEAAG